MKPLPNTTARNTGILSDAFHDKVIAFAGASGSSYLIEKIYRQKPKKIVLIDPNLAKHSTLSRTNFAYIDAVRPLPKVEALANRLRQVSLPENAPEIICYQRKVENVPSEVFKDCDLLVAGTDNLEAQAFLSDKAVALNIPFVAIGIHEAALGGHILYNVPEDNHACYRCAFAERFEGDQNTVNLTGERGNLIDVQSIDMAAGRIMLAILERDQDSLMGRYYEAIRHKGYVVISNHPEYEFGNLLMDALLSDLPKTPKPFAKEFKAYAGFTGFTIWLESAGDPACSICDPQ